MLVGSSQFATKYVGRRTSNAEAALGLWDHSIQLWRTSAGDCVRELEGHDHYITSIAFSHDSNLIIWHTGYSNAVSAVAFSHDSKLIASGSSDNTIRIWSLDTGNCVQELKGHSGFITSVAFSHDSKLIASAAYDETARLWRCGLGWYSKHLSFAKDKLEILTSIGLVAIDGTGGSVRRRPPPAHFVGPSISSDRSWIMWNNDNILRLPAEFRKSDFAISGSTVAIRCASGRVICIRLSADELSDLYGGDRFSSLP
ncbi:WD40-repeat-containing domain protein [Trichoderma barbatum]